MHVYVYTQHKLRMRIACTRAGQADNSGSLEFDLLFRKYSRNNFRIASERA